MYAWSVARQQPVEPGFRARRGVVGIAAGHEEMPGRETILVCASARWPWFCLVVLVFCKDLTRFGLYWQSASRISVEDMWTMFPMVMAKATEYYSQKPLAITYVKQRSLLPCSIKTSPST